MINTPKVTITGSRGFIGTHVRKNICVSYEEIDKVLGTNHKDLTGKTNILIHLSAYKKEDESFHNPELYIDNNVRDLASILIKNNFSGVIFASSYSVYSGKGELEPSSVYGITKLIGEKLVRLYYPNSSWILRASQPYGEYDKASVFYKMAQCKKTGEIFRLFDSCYRDYFNVKLIPEVINRVLQGYVKPGIYNLGSGQIVNTSKFLRYICEKHNIKYKLITPPKGITINHLPTGNMILGEQGDLEEIFQTIYLKKKDFLKC